MPVMLYGSESWFMKESKMGILRRTKRSLVRAIYGIQLKDRKRSKNLMLMLRLNETMDQLAMANSVHWYGHVLRREDVHVLRMALDFEVDYQGKNVSQNLTWKKQVEEEIMNQVGLRREDVLCRSKWSVGVNHHCH